MAYANTDQILSAIRLAITGDSLPRALSGADFDQTYNQDATTEQSLLQIPGDSQPRVDVRLKSFKYSDVTPGRNWSHTVSEAEIEISVTRSMEQIHRLTDSRRDDRVALAWRDGDKLNQALQFHRSSFGGILDGLLQYTGSRYELDRIEEGASIIRTIHSYKCHILTSQNQFLTSGQGIAILPGASDAFYNSNGGTYLDDSSQSAISAHIMIRPTAVPIAAGDEVYFYNGAQSSGRGFVFQTFASGALFRITFADGSNANVVPANYVWQADDANRDHVFGFVWQGTQVALYHNGSTVGSATTATGHAPASGSDSTAVAGFGSSASIGTYVYGASLANGTELTHSTYYTACQSALDIANVTGVTAVYSVRQSNQDADATWADYIGGVTLERSSASVSTVVTTINWDT